MFFSHSHSLFVFDSVVSVAREDHSNDKLLWKKISLSEICDRRKQNKIKSEVIPECATNKPSAFKIGSNNEN